MWFSGWSKRSLVLLVPQVPERMLNARGWIRPVLQVGAGRCHSNVLDAQLLGWAFGGLTRGVAAAAGLVEYTAPPLQRKLRRRTGFQAW